jgi:pyrimidine-nucleoside phosphorylase
MVSGRGLGHTGGTLDKLESIPGFSVNLSIDRFTHLVNTLGLCLIGQTAELAPADRKLYALRDATATVESIPLIASSILSKKLAEGIDALVLDVKVGRGAFMKSRDEARTLARTMVDLCRAVGRGCTALLTAMDEPLGRAVGNACEVRESIEILQNQGPADVRELTLQLGVEMLLAADPEVSEDGLHPNITGSKEMAARLAGYRARLEKALADGSALERFAQLIEAQGGDRRVCDDLDLLPEAKLVREVRATRAGILQSLDAEQVGLAAVELGAGRARKEDAVDPAAGLLLFKKAGDPVRAGDVLAELHGSTEARLDAGEQRLRRAATFGESEVARTPLVLERIG